MTKKDPTADQSGLLLHFCPFPLSVWLKGTLTHQHHPQLPLCRIMAGNPAQALAPFIHPSFPVLEVTS